MGIYPQMLRGQLTGGQQAMLYYNRRERRKREDGSAAELNYNQTDEVGLIMAVTLTTTP